MVDYRLNRRPIVGNQWVFVEKGAVISEIIADEAISAQKLAKNAITSDKIAPNAINSGTIDLSDDYIWGGAHSFTQNVVFDQNITVDGNISVNGTVDGRDIAADGAALDLIQITQGVVVHDLLLGLGDDDHPQYLLADGTRAFTGNVDLGGFNISNVGTVDGRDLTADGTKLDGIEAGATADQTGAEIKILYEAQADTNAFTDADAAKLDGIEAGATADQTDAEIETAYNNQVPQVSPTEKTDGTLTDVRRFTPLDIADMASTHGGSGDVEEAPTDGTSYVRNNGAWIAESPGDVEEAPLTGSSFVRNNGAWVLESPGDVEEAPVDGNQYARRNAAWEVVTGGGGGGSLEQGIGYYDIPNNYFYITYGVDGNWEAIRYRDQANGDETTGAGQTGTKPTTLSALQGLSYG